MGHASKDWEDSHRVEASRAALKKRPHDGLGLVFGIDDSALLRLNKSDKKARSSASTVATSALPMEKQAAQKPEPAADSQDDLE